VAGIIRIAKKDPETNLADILTKLLDLPKEVFASESTVLMDTSLVPASYYAKCGDWLIPEIIVSRTELLPGSYQVSSDVRVRVLSYSDERKIRFQQYDVFFAVTHVR